MAKFAILRTDGRRVIKYNLDDNEKDLGSIMNLCIKGCESLLKEIKNDDDRTFVRHEIALMRQTKEQWQNLIKAFSRVKPSQEFI
ncbi:MAG: hypothetical protein ACPLY9_02740 [Nitrososphaerales archaeon]|jgi:hypothetical protein